MAMTRKTAEKRLGDFGWLLGHRAKGGPFWAQHGYYGTPEYQRIQAPSLEDLVQQAEASPRDRSWKQEWP